MRSRGEFVLTLLLLVVGAGAGLLVATRTWQTLTVSRQAPLGDLIVDVTGRKIDAAPTALFLVALAGVVAVIATGGVWRRLVGLILVAAGAVTVWRSIAGRSGLSGSRAWQVVTDKLPSVGQANDSISVSTGSVWPVLSAVCGALILAAGVLATWRGGAWSGMSRRYENAPTPEDEAARANVSLWNALERGDDPTR